MSNLVNNCEWNTLDIPRELINHANLVARGELEGVALSAHTRVVDDSFFEFILSQPYMVRFILRCQLLHGGTAGAVLVS